MRRVQHSDGADGADWLSREQWARALGAGPDNHATTRHLCRLIRDQEPEVRKVAVESLGKLAPTRRRVTTLLSALDDDVWEVRWAAVHSLAGTARRSAAVRRALERAARDPDPAVAAAARDALATGS